MRLQVPMLDQIGAATQGPDGLGNPKDRRADGRSTEITRSHQPCHYHRIGQVDAHHHILAQTCPHKGTSHRHSYHSPASRRSLPDDILVAHQKRGSMEHAWKVMPSRLQDLGCFMLDPIILADGWMALLQNPEDNYHAGRPGRTQGFHASALCVSIPKSRAGFACQIRLSTRPDDF